MYNFLLWPISTTFSPLYIVKPGKFKIRSFTFSYSHSLRLVSFIGSINYIYMYCILERRAPLLWNVGTGIARLSICVHLSWLFVVVRVVPSVRKWWGLLGQLRTSMSIAPPTRYQSHHIEEMNRSPVAGGIAGFLSSLCASRPMAQRPSPLELTATLFESLKRFSHCNYYRRG